MHEGARAGILSPGRRRRYNRRVSKGKRLLGFAAFLVLLATLLLFGRAIFLGHTFAERDLGALYYGVRWWLAPLTRAVGGIPLWNPFFASGQPFASNPEHEVFYPLTALFWLLPYDWAFRLQVIVPPVLAVPCMYWFLRVLRRTRAAALAGGLAWGFGGYLLSATCLLAVLFAVFPLPLTLGFTVLVLRRPSVANVVGLSFSLALQCLAGEPSTLLLLAPLFAVVLLAQPVAMWRRGVPLVAVGLALGLAIGAAALVPGLHHATRTIRAAGLDDAMANEFAMPPVRILELFSPYLLGHVDRGDLSRYWGRGYYGGHTFAYYYSLYPGLLISLLAIRAWCSRRRALLLWGATALLGFLVALGDRLPFWPLLRHLPGYSGIRFPEKASLLFVFPAIVVGSHGFDWLIMGRPRRRGFMAWALLSTAAVGLLVAGLLALTASKLGSFASGDAIRVALRLSAVALFLGFLLYLTHRWTRQRRGLLLCAFLCLDLVAVGRDVVPSVPVAALASPPAFLRPLLQPGRDDLVFHMAEWDPQRSESGGLAKPPRLARWGLSTTLERDLDFTQLRWTFEGTRAWMLAANQHQQLIEPLLERRGVTAVIRFGPGAQWQGDRLVRPDGGPLVEVLFAGKANGFAFAVDRVEIVHGVSGWQTKVGELGGMVARTACVEDSELPAFANPPGSAKLDVRRSSPEDFIIDVHAEGPSPSFVAINQTWDPQWRVTLDGRAWRLLRTDLALSGVIVPPGEHRLAFEYRDPWVAVGVGMSATAALGALLALLIARRRTRVRSRGDAQIS